ncbi:Ribosome maturation factor RimP [Bienertia sinuspersici]
MFAGDGAEGGGILFAGTWWDKQALKLAESVTKSFDGELGIYAFRTLVNAKIQVRIEKLSTKLGSPSISEIEAFSEAYRAQLDEAEVAKTIPENISLEVSSPGVERIIRIPQELDRFKERPLYIKYVTENADASSEKDGVFKLVSFDLETKCCTWGLADVRINRERAGKGRPMSKKQREWRVTTPFDSIRLARLYPEI